VECFNRTLKYEPYKWFTRKNTYRCLDVMDKFVPGYDMVHSTTGTIRGS
jgi:hypothetical protein